MHLDEKKKNSKMQLNAGVGGGAESLYANGQKIYVVEKCLAPGGSYLLFYCCRRRNQAYCLPLPPGLYTCIGP